MIIKVFTPDIMYSSEKDDGDEKKSIDDISKRRIIIYDCSFKQTDYGSVIIKRPLANNKIELYPQSIQHIIHTLN